MITDYMKKNDLLDIDMFIPTNEQMEKTIKNICETGEISLDDKIVLWKMNLIHSIVNSKGDKL